MDVQVDNHFKPTLLETKGDVLYAQKKTAEAITAYEQALNLLPAENIQREIIQMKILTLK